MHNFIASSLNFKSIRGRLALLALIFIVPLMLDRVRVLESIRTAQIESVHTQLSEIARRGADAQSALITSVGGFLKTAAFIHNSGRKLGATCPMLRGGIELRFEWIRNLSIVDSQGIVICSTMPQLIGMNITDRPYFQKAIATQKLVISDYILGRANDEPMVVAAYPNISADPTMSTTLVASVNLSWLSRLTENIGGQINAEILMIDSVGNILASSRKHTQNNPNHFHQDQAFIDRILNQNSGSFSVTDSGGRNRLISSVTIPASKARLIVIADETETLATIDHDIKAAYIQFVLVGILILIFAWLVSERLIIRPVQTITAMAERFGQGDLEARTSRDSLPAEFGPLATAFNTMASQLSVRDAELRASNNRLSVLASVDVVSGIANRRGFESRLEYEWHKAVKTGSSIALAMIDIDDFKLFNDTYGHPEGDRCLHAIGQVLTEVAGQHNGFAARYGGEEFMLLLHGLDTAQAGDIAERIRGAVQTLEIPHRTSNHGCVTVSIGVAISTPLEGDEPSVLVAAADSGLYAAKHRGRNTVVIHGAIEAYELSGAPV